MIWLFLNADTHGFQEPRRIIDWEICLNSPENSPKFQGALLNQISCHKFLSFALNYESLTAQPAFFQSWITKLILWWAMRATKYQSKATIKRKNRTSIHFTFISTLAKPPKHNLVFIKILKIFTFHLSINSSPPHQINIHNFIVRIICSSSSERWDVCLHLWNPVFILLFMLSYSIAEHFTHRLNPHGLFVSSCVHDLRTCLLYRKPPSPPPLPPLHTSNLKCPGKLQWFVKIKTPQMWRSICWHINRPTIRRRGGIDRVYFSR